MKSKVFIKNLKCGGCVHTIESTLNSIQGVSLIKVDLETACIEFIGASQNDQLNVLKKLRQLGYPPSERENNMGMKAKSLVSCIRGRLNS